MTIFGGQLLARYGIIKVLSDLWRSVTGAWQAILPLLLYTPLEGCVPVLSFQLIVHRYTSAISLLAAYQIVARKRFLLLECVCELFVF